MSKDIKIIVATHKKYDDKRYPSCYYPVQVGYNNDKEDFGYLKDSDGDNIAIKNNVYCELTAQYYAWKNMKYEISGLCHYRRYFIKTERSFKNSVKLILNDKDIEKILSRKKIIIPKLSYRVIENPKLYKDKPKEKQDYHLVKLEEYLLKNHNKYISSWEKFAYGNKISWGNMFISSKEIFDDYSSWMFDILFDLEKQFKEEGKLTPRIMGFISEILLNVWVDHNFKKKEIKYLPVFNTELKEKHANFGKVLKVLGLINVAQAIKFNLMYKKNKY